jgi:hypothetical protein
MKKLVLLTAILLSMLTVSAVAQTKVRVKFAKGARSATLKGTVKGYKYIDYLVRGKGGQSWSVNLQSTHRGCGFVVFYANMENVEGATGTTEFSGHFDADDEYIVRVLLPRSAARRKEAASFSLKIEIK